MQMGNRKTRPDSFSTLIADTGEKALQRALIMGGTSLIDGEVIEWLDIELPVEFSESARRRCFDLIGRTSSNKFIICELKYSRGTNNENESLKHAYEDELMVYKSLIEENYAELDINKVHHTNGKDFLWSDVAKNAQYIIAANKEYWEYHLKQKDNQLPPEDISCYSIDVDIEYFKRQKGVNKQYMPNIPSDCIWERLGTI